MKELSIEEKAKRYDEAIERIKSWVKGDHPECFTEAQKAAEFIFPELKESKDEVVRKAILELVKQSSHILNPMNQKSMIAWLEKQGDHANFYDSIQIGDKVTRNKDGVLVNLSQLNRVAKKQVKPKFSIGDVIEVKPMKCHGKIFIGKPNKIIDITEENYILDDGKAYSIELQDGWKLSEQKPAELSEGDKNTLDFLVDYLLDTIKKMPAEEYAGGLGKAVVLLKSIIDRMHPQPKREWKQENTNDLTDFENAMMHIGSSFFGENAGLDPNDTNAIKEQANLLLELVPSKEWSEEDKNMLKWVIGYLDNKILNTSIVEEKTACKNAIAWLKSLSDLGTHGSSE